MRTVVGILTSPLALSFRPDLAAVVSVFAVAALATAWFGHLRIFLLVLAGATSALAYWYMRPVPFADPMGQMLFVAQRVGATVIFVLVSAISLFVLRRRGPAKRGQA